MNSRRLKGQPTNKKKKCHQKKKKKFKRDVVMGNKLKVKTLYFQVFLVILGTELIHFPTLDQMPKSFIA